MPWTRSASTVNRMLAAVVSFALIVFVFATLFLVMPTPLPSLADLGAMHAGAAAMSIYNTLSPSQVAYVAGHSRPALVVLESADHVARWSQAQAEGSVGQLAVIDADTTPRAFQRELRWTAAYHRLVGNP